MFRASKQIILMSETIKFNNGFILSTIINFNGLILRADQHLAKPIKDFFIANNIEVNRIRVHFKADTLPEGLLFPSYEYYITIHGTFSIAKTDITNFINKINSGNFSNEPPNDLNNSHKSDKLQLSIDEQHHLALQPKEYADAHHACSLEFAGIFANQDFLCSIEKLRLNNDIIAVDDITININELSTTGRIISFINEHALEYKPNAGLMTSFLSKQNIIIEFFNSVTLKDTVLGTEHILIQSIADHSILELNINPKIDWLNNPCHDYTDLFHTTSNVKRYEFIEQELEEDIELEDNEDMWIHIEKKHIPRPLF